MIPRHLPQLVYTWSSVLPNGKGYGVVGSSTTWTWTTNPLDRELHPWIGFLEPEQIPDDTTGLTGIEVVPDHQFGLLIALHRYVGADGMGRAHRHVTVVIVDATRELSTADALTWAEQALPGIDWPLQQPVSPDLPDLTFPPETVAPSHTEIDPSLVALLLQALPRRERIVLPGDAVAPAQLAAALRALPAGFTRGSSISTFPTADWEPTVTLAPTGIPSPQARRPSSAVSHLDPRDDGPPGLLRLSARFLQASTDKRLDDAIADLDALQSWVDRVERTAAAVVELTDTELIEQAVAGDATETRKDACLVEITDRIWEGRWPHRREATPATDRIGEWLADRARTDGPYTGDRFALLHAWGQAAAARDLAFSAAAGTAQLEGFTNPERASIGRELNNAADQADIETITTWLTHPAISEVIGAGWCPVRERLIRHLLEPEGAPSGGLRDEAGHRILLDGFNQHPKYVARVLNDAKSSPQQIHELIANGTPEDLIAVLRVLTIADLTWLPRAPAAPARPTRTSPARAPLPPPANPSYLSGPPPRHAPQPYTTRPATPPAPVEWRPRPSEVKTPTPRTMTLTVLAAAGLVALLILLPQTAALIILCCATAGALVTAASGRGSNRQGGREARLRRLWHYLAGKT